MIVESLAAGEHHAATGSPAVEGNLAVEDNCVVKDNFAVVDRGFLAVGGKLGDDPGWDTVGTIAVEHTRPKSWAVKGLEKPSKDNVLQTQKWCEETSLPFRRVHLSPAGRFPLSLSCHPAQHIDPTFLLLEHCMSNMQGFDRGQQMLSVLVKEKAKQEKPL